MEESQEKLRIEDFPYLLEDPETGEVIALAKYQEIAFVLEEFQDVFIRTGREIERLRKMIEAVGLDPSIGS